MATITVKLSNVMTTEGGTAIKIFTAASPRVEFIQNETCTKAGVAAQPYGVLMIPDPLWDTSISYIVQAKYQGVNYYATAAAVALVTVGNNLTMSDSVPE